MTDIKISDKVQSLYDLLSEEEKDQLNHLLIDRSTRRLIEGLEKRKREIRDLLRNYQLTEKEKELITEGRRVVAIRSIKTNTGLRLADCKILVDKFLAEEI